MKYLCCKECGCQAFFINKINEEIMIVCFKCGDDTRLNDASCDNGVAE